MPAGAEEGSGSSAAVRATQQGSGACSSARWDTGEELPTLGLLEQPRSQGTQPIGCAGRAQGFGKLLWWWWW